MEAVRAHIPHPHCEGTRWGLGIRGKVLDQIDSLEVYTTISQESFENQLDWDTAGQCFFVNVLLHVHAACQLPLSRPESTLKAHPYPSLPQSFPCWGHLQFTLPQCERLITPWPWRHDSQSCQPTWMILKTAVSHFKFWYAILIMGRLS